MRALCYDSVIHRRVALWTAHFIVYHVGPAPPKVGDAVDLIYYQDPTIISPGFRIYIEWVASETDVRLSGMGVPLSSPDEPRAVTVQDLPLPTTAYDRVDDRVFPDDAWPPPAPPKSAAEPPAVFVSLRRAYRASMGL